MTFQVSLALKKTNRFHINSRNSFYWKLTVLGTLKHITQMKSKRMKQIA